MLNESVIFLPIKLTIPSPVFLRSDAAATIYFAARFVQLLFEGGVYFFETSTTAG